MKILHAIRTFSANVGGPTMVASRVAFAQQQAGHDVSILYQQTAGEQVEFPTDEQPQLIPIRPGTVLRSKNKTFHSAVQRNVRNAEAIHIHGVWGPVPYCTADVATREKKPYVICPHGMLNEWSLQQKSLKKNIAFRMGTKRLIENASAIHALSEYEKQCVRDWGYRGPIEVIPNGVDLSTIEPLPPKGSFYERFPELTSNGNPDPYILFLSRLHPVKRLDLLANAFASIHKQHPNVRLVVVGPDWGALPPFIDEIKRLEIADRTHVLGPLWNEDKFAAMADAVCFCLPSDHESFSVAVVEAMACRCPVVISQRCHLPIVSEYDAGIEVPSDADAFAKALNTMVSDRETRERFATNAHSLVKSRFQWPNIADSIVAMHTFADQSKVAASA